MIQKILLLFYCILIKKCSLGEHTILQSPLEDMVIREERKIQSFLGECILLQENANVLWENKKFCSGESNSFAREHNCFVSKCKVSHKISILFWENVNVLWANAKFCGECSHFQRDFSYKHLCSLPKVLHSPVKLQVRQQTVCVLFAKVPHYICVLSQKQYCLTSLTKALKSFFLLHH